MKWSQLTLQEMQRLASIYNSGDREKLQTEAQKLGIKHKTLERRIQSFNMYRAKFLSGAMPRSLTPNYNDYTVVRTNGLIVLSDIEIPDHDEFMLRAALLVAIRYNIKTCVWAGDVIATDQQALNSWIPSILNPDSVPYETAVGMLHDTMKAYGGWFSDQYFVMGNHDDRVGRKTGGEVHLAMLLRDTPTVFSLYRYLYVFDTVAQEWIYIAPPENYSKDSAKLARQFYNVVSAPDGYDSAGNSIEGYDPLVHGKNKAKCHIILGHTHHQQDGWSDDGNYRCIGLGCIRNPTKTHYKSHSATKHSEWVEGFGMWRNGSYTSFSKFGTNWRTVLGDKLFKVLMSSENVPG
jgi:predicted phosphodiesterase